MPGRTAGCAMWPLLALALGGCPHDWASVSPRDGATGTDAPPTLDVRRPDVQAPDVPVVDGSRPDASDVIFADVRPDIVDARDACVPTLEICNGRDDDCNGVVDNGFGYESCGFGPCARTVDTCAGGVPQACVPGPPGVEVCDRNGVDDDCNGTIDDNQCAGRPGGASYCSSYGCCTSLTIGVMGTCADTSACPSGLACIPDTAGGYRCCAP